MRINYTGIHGYKAFTTSDSSSRQQMHSSQAAQNLVTKVRNPRRTQTGYGHILGKHTFSIQMPEDGIIIAKVDRYNSSLNKDYKYNPETVVIYRTPAENKLGCLFINKFHSLDSTYGFEYKLKPAMSQLLPNQFINEGTIFADTPGVTDDGCYSTGVELNAAFMSVNWVEDDGIALSDAVIEKFTYKIYEKRTISFGQNEFPLNIYGDENNYKFLPEIGEFTKDTGALVYLRSYNQITNFIDLSPKRLRQPDVLFDNKIYGIQTKGKIVDIKVFKNPSIENFKTPTIIRDSIEDYVENQKIFYRNILDIYYRETKNKKIDTTPEFSRLIVEAQSYLAEELEKNPVKLKRIYRKKPLDEYTIDITIEYEVKPDIGYKFTDDSAGKGVCAKILKAEEMPIDKEGNRADIIIGGLSTINRMNLARCYEGYFNSVYRTVTNNIINNLNKSNFSYYLSNSYTLVDIINILNTLDKNVIKEQYEYLLSLYKIVSKTQYIYYSTLNYTDKIKVLAYVIKNGIYVFMKWEDNLDRVKAVQELEATFKPLWDTVTYTNELGESVETKAKVRIMPINITLLNKTPNDWSAIASAPLQHHGILSPRNKKEKNSFPWKNNAVRQKGETEMRIYLSYLGIEAAAEMLDRDYNINTHQMMTYNILSAANPSYVYNLVNRDIIPLGNTKPLDILTHQMMCGGSEFVYVKNEI